MFVIGITAAYILVAERERVVENIHVKTERMLENIWLQTGGTEALVANLNKVSGTAGTSE